MFTRFEQPGQCLTGVDRLILLGHTKDLQDTWHNLWILLELLQLEKVKYRLAADLKLINIILGISSRSGKYACFVCYGQSDLVAGPPRTFSHLQEMYNLYQEAGFPQKRMSQFYNVIKPCLINPSDLSTPISAVIPRPELHLHIGLSNWVWNIVKSYLGEQRYPDLLLWC